jgi:hypothetical protein
MQSMIFKNNNVAWFNSRCNQWHSCFYSKVFSFQKHYFNFKTKGYSIVDEIVVDCKKRFIDVFVGLSNSVNNSKILRKWELYKHVQFYGLLMRIEVLKMAFGLACLLTKVNIFKIES